jgi:hypothetical protein
MTPEVAAAELLDVVAELGTDERRVLLALARRLLAGRRTYGRLDVAEDPRDWRSEAAEELLDGAVYLARETMRRGARRHGSPDCVRGWRLSFSR